MKFIVLLFTVLLQKQTKQQGYQRKRTWFARLTTLFPIKEMKTRGQVLSFGALVIVPSLVLGFIVASLTGLFGSILALVLQVGVLLYILGRDDFSQRFETYKACWERDDYQGAYECASQFLNVHDQSVINNPCELHKAVSRAVVYAWFLRFFVFAFWFLVGGVAGALACLLTYWFYREFKLGWVKSVLGAMEWVPSRLLALTTALVGDFSESFPPAVKSLLDFQSTPKDVLIKTVFAKEELESANFDCQRADGDLQETNQLMFRSAVIWLLFVAILTVFTGF